MSCIFVWREYEGSLERQNDESIGALLFSDTEETPGQDAAYEQVESGFFDNMAARPFETSISTMGKTRPSLSGAMAKACGLSPKMAMDALSNLRSELSNAVTLEAESIAHQGFLQVDSLAKQLIAGINQRFQAVS